MVTKLRVKVILNTQRKKKESLNDSVLTTNSWPVNYCVKSGLPFKASIPHNKQKDDTPSLDTSPA